MLAGTLACNSRATYIIHPFDPESPELARVQNVRSVDLAHVRLGAVLPDDRFGVLPASDEHLQHGFGFCWAAGQRQMGIVRSANLEVDHSIADREELVFQFVFGVEFWKKK